MKAIKIILATVVIVAIGFGIKKWVQNIMEPKVVKPAENLFTAKVEEEIDAVQDKADDSFCKTYYTEVESHINDFYQQGRFGKDSIENMQWKKILEKNLYSAYANKFIRQAYYVLNNRDWYSRDLRFIRSEVRALKKSTFFVAGSPVAQDFKSMNIALDKFYEIVNFIMSCRRYSFLGSNLSDSFPTASVRSKIQRAADYRTQRLGNSYVHNCKRLYKSLEAIPTIMFEAHIKYLDNKIDEWSGMYSNYASQKEYYDNLYVHILAEIDALDNAVYKVNTYKFGGEYDRLLAKWKSDNIKAYDYEYNTDTNEE